MLADGYSDIPEIVERKAQELSDLLGQVIERAEARQAAIGELEQRF